MPVFNLKQWGSILPVFTLSLLVGLADEILQLLVGCYCKLVMISNIVCGAIQIVLSAVVLKVMPIWNPNFVSEIQLALGDEANLAEKFLSLWNADMVSNGLLALIVLFTLVEISVTVYKTLRYGAPIRNR